MKFKKIILKILQVLKNWSFKWFFRYLLTHGIIKSFLKRSFYIG